MTITDRRGLIVGAQDPTTSGDLVVGLAWKVPALVATTANITLSGTQTIDGVAVVAGNRVLVKDQTDQKTNGIYDVAAGAWARSVDFDESSEILSGTQVLVTSGTAGGGVVFRVTTSDPITIDTSDLVFVGVSSQPLDATLTALAALNSTAGLVVQTAGDTFTKRTLTGTANEIEVAAGDGAAGNPTLSLPDALDFTGKTVTGGTFATPTITTPDIDGGTADGLTSLGVRTTGTGAFDVKLATAGNLTATRTLSVQMNDANRALDLAGGITIAAGGFATAGGNATTLTTTGATNVTLPTTGTLATLAGLESLSNKTIAGATVTGVIDAGGATSFEIPNDAAPTVNADGEIAVDTTVTDFSHGIIKYYCGEELGVVAMPIAQFTTPGNGAVPTYNSTTDEFEMSVPAGGGDFVGPASSTDNAAVRFDSTTGKLGQNSALIIADTTGSLSRSGNGGIPVQGTNTNDSAAAGYVGEYTSATRVTGSAFGLTTNTQTNITSVSLTAGDWDVWGTLAFNTNAATVVSNTIGGVSTTSATLPDPTSGSYFNVPGDIHNPVFPTGVQRISLASTTTVYLVAYSSFLTNTQAAWGGIFARRVR